MENNNLKKTGIRNRSHHGQKTLLFKKQLSTWTLKDCVQETAANIDNKQFVHEIVGHNIFCTRNSANQ